MVGPAGLAPAAVALPLLAAALVAALGRFVGRVVIDVIAVITALAVAACTGTLLAHTLGGGAVTWLGGWRPHHGLGVGIGMVVDPIGASFALLAAVLVLAALVYSWRFFESVEALFHVLVLCFLAAMAGFALTGDLFDMFVWFELMGAVAYALTGYKIEEPRPLQGALNFAIVNSLGAYCTLLGVALLYGRTGELGLAQIGRRLTGHHADMLVIFAFALVCTGFLVKAAAVPFHFWLADAHAVAPTPVCVIFSGVMVELGVYAVARVYWVAFSGALPAAGVRHALLALGVATAALGTVMCAFQHHIKRMLAYSTIGHVGLLLVGLAALTKDGVAGVVVYVLAHAGAKSALFLASGMLLNRFATVDERELHGAGRRMPVTAALFFVGGAALAGTPPFGTALGKSMTEEAVFPVAGPWVYVLFTLVAAITAGAALRVALRVFLGAGRPPRRADAGEERERPEAPGGRRLRRTPLVWAFAGSGLLAVALAAGALPAGPLSRAAEMFTDRRGYADLALHGTVAPRSATTAHSAAEWFADWTASGITLGLVSCVLAFGCAAVAVWSSRLPAAVHAAARSLTLVVAGLRRAHSGHLGDYVVWMLVGIAVLTALLAA